jgi:hypothetical protein
MESIDQSIPLVRKERHMKVDIEYTDTFAGEPNYSWVRRELLDLPEDSSETHVMMKAKNAVGIDANAKCDVSHYGDTIEIRPCDACTVVFVTFRE